MATPESSSPLSTYPLEKLLQLWRREDLTIEQMVGHLLQHLAALEAQGQALQRQVNGLEQAIKPLIQP
ncbi:MAG: hypothetical protein R3C14_04055 [Caldilineaceae bacterium]